MATIASTTNPRTEKAPTVSLRTSFLRRLVASTLLALSLGASGQETAVWRATVVAGESGEPLAGISFRATNGDIVATSDASGAVAFSSEPGATLDLSGGIRIASHIVLGGEPRDLGSLALERSAVLLGRLLDPAGQPAVGQRVWLVSPHTPSYYVQDPGYAGHLYRLTTTTLADGSFRFEGFWTTASRALLVGEEGQVIRRFGSIPRETIDIGDVRLPELVPMRGTVATAAGQPAAGARVAFGLRNLGIPLDEDPERLHWRRTATDDDGHYSLDLAPGVYRAIAGGNGVGEIPVVEVRAEGPTAIAPSIRLGPTRTIGGRVVDDSGSPMVGVEMRVDLTPQEQFALPTPQTAIVTDGQGCWEVENVPTHELDLYFVGQARELVIAEAGEAAFRSCADAEPTVLNEQPTGRVRVVVDICDELPVRCEVTHQTLDETRSQVLSWGSLRVIGTPGDLDLEEGTWIIRARASGYVTEEREVLVETGREKEIRFDLQREADAVDVKVRVLGPRGYPASLTTVNLVVEDSRRDVRIEQALTGVDGIATFPSVPAGLYSLRATRMGYSESARRWLDLPADDAIVQLQLAAKPRSARIAGSVVDSDGAAVGGATVLALEDDGYAELAATVTAFDGSFLMAIPPGAYRLSAHADHAGSARLVTPRVLAEGAEAEHTLTLERGGEVNGQFLISGGSDSEIHFGGPHEWLLRNLLAWTTSDGKYHIRGLPPGSWTFEAYLYPSNRRVSFVIEMNDDLSVDAPSPVLDFEPYFNVSGRVLMHGSPLIDASVGGGRTDADGRFETRSQSGTTELLVGGLAAPFRYEIEPLDGDREVEIVVHGAHVGGEVLDKATGEPIRTAEISLLRDERVGFSHSYNDSHRVDGLGRFDFGILPAGRWTVRIRADGYTTEVVELDVQDEEIELLVEHEPTSGLRLHVSDANGDAVYGVGLAVQRPGETARLFDGWFRRVHDLWWPSAPTGPALLTVGSGDRSLFYRGEIVNTGAPIDIVLRPGGWLQVHLPEELVPDESTPKPRRSAEWQAQLVGGDGVAVLAHDHLQMTTSFERRGGDPLIEATSIPPGEYQLIVHGPDGFEWSTRVLIRAGEQVRVQVPAR